MRPVRVDGKPYDSMALAAAAIGSDRTAVSRAAKYGHLLKGHRITYVREANCILAMSGKLEELEAE